MDEFDSLKREATRLERHLEDKVARYQQLAQRLTTSTSTLLDSVETGSSSANEESQLQSEISRTIAALGDLLSQKLGPAAERSGKPQHALLVKRYREILYDLKSDFTKANLSLQRKRQQAELFQGKTGAGGQEEEEDGSMAHLLRERNHINNSLNASAAVIGQATEIHADLRSQGTSLQNSNSMVAKITNTVPGLNNLVEQIRRKRSKDEKILAGVIASCILFTLWYLFG